MEKTELEKAVCDLVRSNANQEVLESDEEFREEIEDSAEGLWGDIKRVAGAIRSRNLTLSKVGMIIQDCENWDFNVWFFEPEDEKKSFEEAIVDVYKKHFGEAGIVVQFLVKDGMAHIAEIDRYHCYRD